MRHERPPRTVAVWIPDLPLQRIVRGRHHGEPSRRGAAGREPTGAGAAPPRPLAVIEEGRVLCRDAAAASAGVRPGAPLAEALAACGRLVHVAADAAADRAALAGLAEALLGIAPAVEISPPDLLLLDASAAHLLAPRRREMASSRTGEDPVGRVELPFPEREGEDLLARQALAVAGEMGYAARAAVATGRGPARALVRGARGPVSWFAPDAAAAALAPLPVAALGLPAAVAARLAAVGIERAGVLARLPQGTLAHRFGEDGVLAARLARGEDGSPLVPYVPQTLPEEAIDLEAPAENADPLLFGLKRLADRVAARLAGRGLGASRLKIVLRLDPRGEERLLVPLATPSAAPARWLLPVKEHLFSLRLPAPVVAIRLAAIEVAAVVPEQLAIGDRPEALAALEGVLSRLAVRLGDGALFAAEPVERHRPEAAYRTVPFSPRPRRSLAGLASRASSRRGEGGDPPATAEPSGPEPARPTRLLALPAPVVAEGEGGRVTALRVDGRARAVLAMVGPERLRGEWWAGPFDRDYYRVRLDGLGDCWVYRDGGDGRLYLHGFFD